MRKTSIVAAAFVLLILSGSVFAQEEWEGRDVLEVAIFGGVGVPSGGITDWTTGGQTFAETTTRKAKTGLDLGIDIGYYLKPNVNIGLNFMYTQFDAEAPTGITIAEGLDKQKHRLYNPNVYLKYNFEGESNFVPFLKAHVGLDNPKFSTWVLDHNDNSRKFRELSYDPAFAFGASAGLFYYTADFSGVFVEAGYHMGMTDKVKATYQGDEYEFGENTGVIWINAGIKLIVGSGS